ncbi:MAG: hypothetical protein IQL11_05100 [Bacteroidales bacterium]|nr:hypothetical protein [Bacteroidales bacterium]
MEKVPGKNNQQERQSEILEKINVREYDLFLIFVAVFILTCLYFYLFGSYIFFYQENQSLFVYSCEYLQQFAAKPGGLLEYTGNFLTQGFFSKLYGSLLLSVIITLIAITFFRINKKLTAGKQFLLLFAALASCVLLLMQANFIYLIHNTLGFLLTGLYFLFSVSTNNKISRYSALFFYPLFFYLTGAYALIYLGMFTVFGIIMKKVVQTIYLLIIAGLTILIFKEFIFLQPWSEIFYYPLPSKDYFIHPVILLLLFLFFIFYPALVKLISLVRINAAFSRNVSRYSVLITFLVTIFLLSKIYNIETADLFKLEKMFFARDWNGVIKQQEALQMNNLVAQYYYNTALAEKNQLCDRMFFSPQNYGIQSVMIPWSSQISISRLFRGVYFYYCIGLINEAHRWAFESMVTEGYRPENIKLLIKTNLINGHYKIAAKYIMVLKRTLHYRSLAKQYEGMILNPELIRSDPELGEKIKLQPEGDFIVRIRNPENNVDLLMEANPGNKKAYEYKMACLMLEKNVEGIVNEMTELKAKGYTKIPGHLEEAALLYNEKTGFLPDLNGFKISSEAEERFLRYRSAGKSSGRIQSPEGQGINKELRNTFWYYVDFK